MLFFKKKDGGSGAVASPVQPQKPELFIPAQIDELTAVLDFFDWARKNCRLFSSMCVCPDLNSTEKLVFDVKITTNGVLSRLKSEYPSILANEFFQQFSNQEGVAGFWYFTARFTTGCRISCPKDAETLVHECAKKYQKDHPNQLISYCARGELFIEAYELS